MFKSVHITNYYHKNSGGISNSYNKLLEAANRHRRFMRLIVPGERDEVEEIGEYGRIYYIETKNFPLFDKRYRVMLPWNSYLQNDTPIRRILIEEQPDIVEISEKYSLSLLAGIIRMGHFSEVGRPLLVHYTCERMDDNVRSFISGNRLAMWFSRRVMGNYNFPMFDFHIANSDYTAQEILDSVSLAKNSRRSNAFLNFCWQYFQAGKLSVSERVFVNFCGVDSVRFNDRRKSAERREQILREFNLPSTAKILLYAGRISPEKNVCLLADLMKSLKNHPDYFILIAGDGPKFDWLKKRLDELAPGKAILLGHLTDGEKLADLYANADVFVHPNPHEPFGIAPLEAMASGTPVVAPNSGGLLSYASDKNAWLVAPQAEDFAAAIHNIFAEPEQCALKVANALQTARHYTWEASTDKLLALYDKMYEDFCRRREFYVCGAEAKKTDFAVKYCSSDS